MATQFFLTCNTLFNMNQLYCKPWAFVTRQVTRPKPIRFVIMLASAIFLLTATSLQAQVTLSADGPGNTYQLIESRGFGIESPDCGHTSFGPHVTEVFDNTLNKNVFVFHSHATADDDRCGADDRVRMEIKGGSGSPAAMQHTQGQTAYYRWKFRLDPGFIPSSRFTHIFQIKAIEGDAGAPLVTITPRAGNPQRMQIIHSAGEGSGSLGTVHQVDLAPFKGTWVEAFVTYKSSEGSAGTFSITIKRVSDGATLLSYSRTGIDMWREGADYNRGKWGVYRGKDPVLRDEQVRFADFCISESSASQCPSDAGNGGGGETNLSAQHDAYVRDGTNAGTAFGSTDAAALITKVAPAGQLNNNRETYLTFNTSSVTGTISSAILRVYGRTEDGDDANVPVGVYAVSNTSWTESAITWNNKPASASSPLATTTVTNETGRYYTWDITSYVNSERAAGRSTVSLVLKNQQTTEGRLIWNSKETGGDAPQLAITTSSSLVSAREALNETAAITTGLNSFPNPFNDANTIAFTLDQPAHVNLAVHDITGKQVAMLVNANLQAGVHRRTFTPKQLASGVYMIRLAYNDKVITQKLLKI
jgi:hypothetical protein